MPELPVCFGTDCLQLVIIRNTSSELQINQGSDGAIRIMRRHRNVMRFGHGGNLFQACDSAAIHDVALQDVNGLRFEEGPNTVNSCPTLACRDRNGCAPVYLCEDVMIFRRNRLFNKHQIDVLQLAAKTNRSFHVEPAVTIDANAEIRTHCFPARFEKLANSREDGRIQIFGFLPGSIDVAICSGVSCLGFVLYAIEDRESRLCRMVTTRLARF